MLVIMKFAKETKGAVVYNEVDNDHKELDMVDSKIGTLYLRKSSEIGKAKPDMITVEVKGV